MNVKFLCASFALLCSQMTNAAEPDEVNLLVDSNSDARTVLTSIPPYGLIERFEFLDATSRQISYVSFSEGETGALVFVNSKLFGSLNRAEALAFFSCRAYATATQSHWIREGNEWTENLLKQSHPVSTVQLNFSPKNSRLNLLEIANSSEVSQVSSLISIGTNPLNIINKLSSMNASMKEKELFSRTLNQLRALTTGASEDKVAEITRPEDISFVKGGVVMSYPKFLVEFFVNDGTIKLIQQPSFHQLSHKQAALFYLPSVYWEKCTPDSWPNAITKKSLEWVEKRGITTGSTK